MTCHNFGPAEKSEKIVFGASRPGYYKTVVTEDEVQQWIEFMRRNGIERVVCLLSDKQLRYYQEDLVKTYKQAFGLESVLSAPIGDFHLSSLENLRCVLDFLEESKVLGQKVVVHCSGGLGRTGHVLAGWLVRVQGLDPEKAIKAIEKGRPPRRPKEAVNFGYATMAELLNLLNKVSRKR
jgi:protein-tyrosine phosphatase